MEEHSVSVYIYDISKGFAKTMSPLLLGKQLDGIWHTGIVVYGQEFFFGGEGIQSCDPGTTILQQPDKIIHLGNTQIPYDMFLDYIHELASTSFRPETYHLLNHNCNTFSSEVAQFLTGSSIPSYITDLPQEFLNTPLGAMVRPYLDALTVSPSGGSTITSHAETAANSASNQCNTDTSAGHDSTPTTSAQQDSTDTTVSQPRCLNTSVMCEAVSGSKKRNEQDDSPTHPVTYMDVKLAQREYAEVKDCLKSLLNSKEIQLMDEILEYVTTDEPLWGLVPKHMAVIDKILSGSQFSEIQKEAVCGLFQECLYHTDIIMMLKHDTNNTYNKILSSFEQQNTRIKAKLAKGLCNCISTVEGMQWLFNEDVTHSNGIGLKAVNVCRCCILDTDSDINDIGAALVLSVKQVSTELAVDFGCALVELLKKDTWTETAKNGILALCQCIKSNNEVAAIAVVSGLDPDVLAEKHPSIKHLCINYLKKHLSLP